MCGIIGIASNLKIVNRDLLVSMRDTMFHRGPDDAGEWWSADGRVGLAHRRLAIIDLSPAGHQPMIDSSGQFAIVLKGEWGRRLESILAEADGNLFSRKEIKTLLENQRRGYSNSQRLFALSLFELWRREYNVKG